MDTEFVYSKMLARIISGYGYPISTEECIRRFTGVHENICRQLIMKESNVFLPEDYWTSQRPILIKDYEKELTPLLQPVLEILEESKIPRCVASNNQKENVVNCLSLTKQMKYFTEESIFTSQQVAKGKPAPDLFLFAAKEMGMPPENCIVIEDSPIGAQAAIAAGMEVFLFLGGSHAKFHWYHSQMAVHNRPIVSTCEELSHSIQQAITSYN